MRPISVIQARANKTQKQTQAFDVEILANARDRWPSELTMIQSGAHTSG